MALRDFLFGFKFMATDYVSPVLKNIETRIEAINTQVKNTARWREAGVNIGMVGAGLTAVGAAGALAIKSAVDAAAGMDTVMTHVATAMSDGAAQQVHLAQVKEMAEKVSIASGIAAVQEAQAYYMARSNSLDHAQALAAVNTATKLVIGTTASLAEAQQQLDPSTRLLTNVYQTFGDKTKNAVAQMATYGDQLSKLQTHYAFRGQEEINNAMTYAIPLSKAAGVAFADQNAALALLSEGNKHGAEAGTAYGEVVSKLMAGGKLKAFTVMTAQGGIDLGKTVARLHAATAGLSVAQRGYWLHQMGFTERSVQGVGILIDKTAEYKSVVADLSAAQGANQLAYATRLAAPDVTWGRLAAAFDVLRSKLGEPLLGPMLSLVNGLTKVAARVADLASAHPQITKFVVMFAAIASAIALVAGGVMALVGGFLVMASFAPALAAVVLPITLIGTAVAAAAAAVATWAPWMFAAGANIVKAIASGIWSAASYPARAIEHVLAKVRSYLPFSPAREGPLRSLNRIRIVETIAESIKPGPMLAAIRRTAAATAIAAPLTFAPMMAAPAFAGAPGGTAGGGIVIQVHQEIHIDGASAADEHKLMAVLRHHGEELAQIIDARMTHRNRREF